jgi:hypothetical protein
MSSFNQGGASARLTAKMKAQKHLSTLRELSTWIFRHLNDNAKFSKDEVPPERSEMHRAQFIQAISQAQAQLRQAVADIQKQSACTKSIAAMRINVASREALLSKCGQSLRSAENMLSLELKRHRSLPGPLAPNPVTVDVDDFLRYACTVSHFSQAASDAEDIIGDAAISSNAALVGAFPPHPHMDLLSRSRLFTAAAGRPGANCRRIHATAGPSAAEATGPSAPPLVRPPPKRARAAESDHFAEPRPAKRPFAIPSLEECLRAAAAAVSASSAPAGGDGPWWWSGAGDVADCALAAAVPARPAAWRPGDAVAVGPAQAAP